MVKNNDCEKYISFLKKSLIGKDLNATNSRYFIKSMNYLSSNNLFKNNFTNIEAKILFNHLKELKKDKINFLPDILLKYKSEILKHKREYIRIIPTPLKTEILKDPLDLKQSKLLGTPFIPKEVKYPKDNSGNYMLHLIQLNFEEIPNLKGYPEKGILQLYFSPDNWYNPIKGNYKVLFFDEDQLNQEHLTDFSFINKLQYEYTPIYRIHKLDFEKAFDYGNFHDRQFGLKLDNKSPYSFVEELNDKNKGDCQLFFSDNEHKIGGYSEFVQDDPREIENSGTYNSDKQLLQLNIDKYIVFGDNGIVHLLITENNFNNKDFGKAYFHWDCG